jgi:mono/diheme cytochrome c family protein
MSRPRFDLVLFAALCFAAALAWFTGCAAGVPTDGAALPQSTGGSGGTAASAGGPSAGGSSTASGDQQPVAAGGQQTTSSGGQQTVSVGGARSQPSVSWGGGATGSGGTSSQPGSDAGVGGSIGPWDDGVPVPHGDQKAGDPDAGYDYLTSGGYFGCGIPARFFGLVSPFATLQGISAEPLPGRTAMVNNQPLPYTWNLAKNSDGLDVVYMNCLQCHAGKFNGKLVIGLGNADADWTQNLGNAAPAAGLLGLLGPTPQEQAELDKFIGRLKVIGGPAVMRTVGTNPAEMLATTFVSHRDRNTLAWSDTALLTIPAIANLPQGSTVTSKTPPWWRMSKKFGQFYNGMGRGDHRRSEMLAGSLCTDSVPQAEAIDAHFNDVAAYITSIKAPIYPFSIDKDLAAKGHDIFNGVCAGCHGHYAPDAVSYPNLLIPQAQIATDPVVGLGGTTKDYGSDLVDWYNQSWYGQVGHYVPFNGYVAPPLDGVWATAPYLHNGSVPDIATLLDSQKRPKYWRRADHDTTHYDQKALGFPWVPLSSGQGAPPLGVAAKDIYDTDQYSHANTGHDYGDPLTDDQRSALIEYLKTL